MSRRTKRPNKAAIMPLKIVKESATMSTYSGDFSEFQRYADPIPTVSLDPRDVRRHLSDSTNSISPSMEPEEPRSQSRPMPHLRLSTDPPPIRTYRTISDTLYTPTAHVTTCGECFSTIFRFLLCRTSAQVHVARTPTSVRQPPLREPPTRSMRESSVPMLYDGK